MGSPESEPHRQNNETQHQVTITKPFLIGETTVTQELYESVMNKNPSKFIGKELPVEHVSWNDAVDFCERISEITRLTFELPTEGQWEYACRAGTTTAYHWGNTITKNQFNFNNETTVKVKRYPSNAFGLYQMHGNVWEWCYDWYSNYPEEPVIDPSGPDTGDSRVARGGSWRSSGEYCRAAYRYGYGPDIRYSPLGFRLAAPVPVYVEYKLSSLEL